MDDVSIVQIEDLQEDLQEFLFRAQRRSYRQNLKKVKEYVSKLKSERSIYNRVPLDGVAVLSINEARDKTFDLIKRLMKLVMCQEVLVTLRDYLKVCNHLEVRLQSLIYHIAQCPQYDLEIIDINTQLDSMETIVSQLESEYRNDEEGNEKLLETCGLLQFVDNTGEEKEEGNENKEEETNQEEDDDFQDAQDNTP
uniref:Vacuolar protein sorting-associated protein 51 homolog n=1 Tax=Caenorhabditis tropicalis TaxID=1561998 RepID=A0A1I7TB09_9PELO